MITTKVAQVWRRGFIPSELGRISFGMNGGSVAVMVWEATPAISSADGRIEEIEGRVPDLSCIHLVTGLFKMGLGIVPVNQRTSQVLIVEPKDLPVDFGDPEVSCAYDYLAFCTDLFERTGRTQYEQRNWINLTDRQEDRLVKQAMLQQLVLPDQDTALARTGLINLCEGDGTPRNEASLGEDMARMHAELMILART